MAEIFLYVHHMKSDTMNVTRLMREVQLLFIRRGFELHTLVYRFLAI